MVGLPADTRVEYEPFQVDLLLLDGEEFERLCDIGGEGVSNGPEEEPGLIVGEGGAYISESWETSVGDVRAEKSWRTLSHCVWVVWSEDWRATRMEEEGDVALVEP